MDYRKLNSVTIPDVYPLSRIDELLRFFSTMDLLSGYWHVLLGPDVQDKTAIKTRDGLWK